MAMHIAKGIKFKIGEQAIGRITSIGGVEISCDEEETTAVTDTDGYRSFVPTFRDAGNMDIEGIYDDDETANFDAVAALAESDTLSAFTVEYPGAEGTAKKWSFKGYLSKFKFGEASPGGLLKWSASIRVSGKPVLS